jgi:anthranilate/para-aminobenzoate synthase component I
VVSYRIISLEQSAPQVIYSPKRIIFISGTEITLYKERERFEAQYFVLSNMDQFDIVGFYNELLLRLKEDGSMYTMTLGGTLRPLAEGRVSDCWLALDRVYLLY